MTNLQSNSADTGPPKEDEIKDIRVPGDEAPVTKQPSTQTTEKSEGQKPAEDKAPTKVEKIAGAVKEA